MIRSKMNINGRVIAVCKVENPNETISGMRKETDLQSYKSLKSEKAKYVICSMIEAKQKFEVALLKLKLKINK